jgi:hypothetical protein
MPATPLAFAAVGSGEREGEPGDWVATVRLLLEAGAARQGVWITDKPPSEQVAYLLRGYGLAPERRAGDNDADSESHAAPNVATPGDPGAPGVTPDTPAARDDDVLSEMARQLEAACREGDLDVLASLLHPEVQWTGLCRTRAQVLDWYRLALADGTTPTVESVEVDRDAVIVGISLTRPARGARPAPPQRLFRVFTVNGAQIVKIHGYPSRRSALNRD